MNGQQAKEARRLLGWTIVRLASRLNISEKTIAVFESTGHMHQPREGGPDRVQELRETFETAGIEFDLGNPDSAVRRREANAG